jgi:Domain of Unknown Function with PDB structure (DUF3857)
MKRKNLVIIVLSLLTLYVKAQDLKYNIANLPDSLKKDANTVYHLDEATLSVDGPGRYTYKVHQVFTILNKDGAHHLRQVYGIDKFYKMSDIEMKVYNAFGKEIDKYKKKDFAVNAAYDGMSLITDDKVMSLQVAEPAYPCTVELSYELDVTSSIMLPSWVFQNYEESVLLSRLSVKMSKGIDLRYKLENIKLTPVITEKDDTKTYFWEARNLIPKQRETGAGQSHYLPWLTLVSNEFSYDGYKGDFKDWKSFGEWNYPFYEETKEPFSETRKKEIQALVKDAKTDDEKISILYKHMQKNFRYVSIQLGIGGFKPFPVSFVDEKKYGDCKALSNYMRYLLKEVGIKSYAALVRAKYDADIIDKDFPMDPFNHVILCVPRARDSIWLECTSNTSDFAVLGNFTENRYALLLTEKGGILVPTPRSKSSDNIFCATTKVNLQEDGTGKTSTNIFASGEYKQDFINYLFNEKKDDQKSVIVNSYGFKQPDEFEVEKKEEGNKFVTNLSMSIEKIPEFLAGSKMFLTPRLYKIWSIKLPKAENRHLDYYFECPFEKTDTTIFKLPEGFISDALPTEKNIKCEYASYNSKYWYSAADKSVYSTAKLVLLQHKIPAAKYAGVKTFFDDVLKEDAQRIVVKKE